MKEHAEPYDTSSHVAVIAVVPVQCRHGLGMCRPWPATDQMDRVTAMHIYLLCHRRNHAAFNRGEEDVVVVLRRSWLQNHLQALRGLCERKVFNDASTPQESLSELHQQCRTGLLEGYLPAGPHRGPLPADQILGAARSHEPKSPLIAAGQACRSLCATGADLWLVHRGV